MPDVAVHHLIFAILGLGFDCIHDRFESFRRLSLDWLMEQSQLARCGENGC